MQVAQGQVGHHYRIGGWVSACFFPGMFMLLAITRRGYVSLASWLLFLLVAIAFGTRLIQECRIISAPVLATGVVNAFRRKPLEAGHIYSVRYRFRADDGKEYIGSSGWTGKKLPAEEEPIQILYWRKQPSRNLPIFDFRFYKVVQL